MGDILAAQDSIALGALGHRAVPSLLSAVRQGKRFRPPKVSGSLVYDVEMAISFMEEDGKAVCAQLIQVADDPDESLRFLAAAGLGNIHARAAIALPVLKRLLGDKSSLVQETAKWAIENTAEARAARLKEMQDQGTGKGMF